MVQMLSVVRTLCCCYKKERPTEGNDTKLEEAGEAPPTCIDLERYTEPKSIWVALETGHVRLVKMSWLIEHSKNGRILARRQELPEEAFISVAELKRLYGDGNRDGVLPIIAISFCWLTPWHPDPEGKQLKTIAATLEREQAKYAQASGSFKGFSEMGVFWDWASLYQLVPSLWRPFMTGPEAKPEAEQTEVERELTKAYFSSRTKEEQEGFTFALHKTMDLWCVRRPNRRCCSRVQRTEHAPGACSPTAGTRTRARPCTCSPSCPRARRARSATRTRAGPLTSGARLSRSRRSS